MRHTIELEGSQQKEKPFMQPALALIKSELGVQGDLAARYIQCVEELLDGSVSNCQVPDSILSQPAAERYDNLVTYEKKLSFRMYQLLAADLRELADLLGRNATRYTEHKQLTHKIVSQFELIEPECFGSKAFIEKNDHIQRTFQEVWMKDNKADKKQDSTKLKEITSPQKGTKPNPQSPQKTGTAGSDKKHILKHGAGYESARKTDKDILNLRDSSKDLSKSSQQMGIEAVLPQRKKKGANTTITVVSKHNPRADVTQAFRWRPEESLLMTKLNKERAALEEEYRQVEERIQKREEEERKIREEEAKRLGKNRAGSKGKRARDEYLTTSSETGKNEGKLDESINSQRNRSGPRTVAKEDGFQHVADNGEGDIKIEGSGTRQTKAAASAIPPAMNKQLDAEEVEETTHENFKSLEYQFKFRRKDLLTADPVKSVAPNGKDGLVVGLEFGLVYKIKGLATNQPVAKPFFNGNILLIKQRQQY